MLYTPAEIGEIIGFGRHQFYRVYVPAGCPHQREDNGRLWVNGKAFREWYLEHYPKISLADDEAYCLVCKKIVPLSESEVKQKGTYIYQSAICPDCGHGLSKAISNKHEQHD